MKTSELQQTRVQNQPVTQRRRGMVSLESQHTKQLTQLEVMANESPQSVAQRRITEMIHNSPHMIVQRENTSAKFGKITKPDPKSALFQREPTSAQRMMGEKPQIQGQTVAQRMVALGDYKKVYVPELLKPKKEEEQSRLKTSINTLCGNNYELEFATWIDMSTTLEKNLGKETKKELRLDNKYEDKDEAKRLIKVAVEEQQNSRTAEERKNAVERLGESLDNLELAQHHKKRNELYQEFLDESNVFTYPKNTVLEEPWTEGTRFRLLEHKDMYDKPGSLGSTKNSKDCCAIETISDLGGNVKSMWSDKKSSTDVDSWHRACKDEGLDYRNDNEYIKILMKLGYKFVLNKPVKYSAINWNDRGLGDGSYFLGTGAGDIGHAIGVSVSDGIVDDIYDRQGLHSDDEIVKYIFKK